MALAYDTTTERDKMVGKPRPTTTQHVRYGPPQILRMQGLAGNRAVAQLLDLQRRGPIPTDECPCHGSTDGGDARPATAEHAVQRLAPGDITGAIGTAVSGAADTVGAGLSGAVGGLAAALGKAKAIADGAETHAKTSSQGEESRATGELGRAASQVDSDLDKAGADNRHAAEGEKQATEQRAQNVIGESSQLGQRIDAGSKALTAATPTLNALLSPVTAILEPSRLAGAGSGLDSAAAQASAGRDSGGLGGQLAGAANAALGPAAAPTWNCDLSELVGHSGKASPSAVTAAVNPGQRPGGSERFAAISAFTNGLSTRIGSVGSQLKSALTAIGGSSTKALQGVATPLLKRADSAVAALGRGMSAVTSGLSTATSRIRDGFQKKWSTLTAGVDAAMGSLRNKAAQTLTSAGGSLSSLLGSIGKAVGLPAGFTAFTQGIPGRVAGTNSFLANVGRSLSSFASGLRDKTIAVVKNYVNTQLQGFAALRQAAQSALDRAKKAAQSALAAVGAKIGAWRDGAIGKIIAKVQQGMRDLQQAADQLVKKIRGGACAVLGTVGEPCLTQHLPDLGGSVNNTIRLVASADLILPLAEFGVPGNLKVGAGAAIEVTARDGLYILKVDGAAQLMFNELSGGEAHAEGGTPALPQSNLAQSWQALTTGSVANAGSATTGPGRAANSTPAPAGTGVGAATADAGATAAGAATPGGGQTTELNVGLKGRSTSEWRFDATKEKTSCEGVGGLVALLAMMGVAGALPAPFNTVGGTAVYGAFLDQLQYSRFSVGIGGEVSGDLKAGGLGTITGRAGADVSENIETVRDPLTGQLVMSRTRTVTAELDAATRGKLTVGPLGVFDAFLTGEGIVRLTMAYRDKPEAIVPTEVGGAIKVSVGVKDFDPGKFLRAVGELLPDAVEPIRSALSGGLPGLEGAREVSLALIVGRTYTGLEPMASALNEYFNGPPQNVNVDGVIKIVKEHLDQIKPVDLIKVELSQVQRKRIDVGEKLGVQGVGEGAEIDAAVEHEISRVWQNFSGHEAVIDAAAARTRTVPGVAEPEKKKPPSPGKHRAPTGTADDPIQMTWYKRKGRYARVFLGEPGKKEEYPKDKFKKLPPPDQDTDIGVIGFAFPGAKFARTTKTPRDGAVVEQEFKELLEHHGFDWRGLSPDHVFDLAWGGDNEFHNLWPLDSRVNSEAGRLHNFGQTVEYNYPDDPEDQPPRRSKVDHPDFIGRHFQIGDIRDP